jgi:hypothetical protein
MIMSRGLLIAAMIALSVSAMAHVCTAEAVSVSISDVTCELHESVIVPITLSGVTNYGTGTINITYNPGVVHVTNVAGTYQSTLITSIDNTTGITRISAWNTGGVSGDVLFANITLKSVGPCQSPLNITIAKLRDTSFAVIPATVENGSFTTIGQCPGDLNEDCEITPADAMIALRMAVRHEYSIAADLDGDDRVTALDALMILQEAARQM